jgi:hypothetical protein
MIMEGNVIELVSPVGYPRIEEQAKRRSLGSPVGKRLGFVWNQYQTTRVFWPLLEQAVEKALEPSSVQRAYKANTWTPLEKERFEGLVSASDCLVIGVGA